MAPSATAVSSSTNAALSALALCNLKELHLKRADGSRILDSLHATCRTSGLIPSGTPDASPRERYLAVFDAALHGGLGCWILDYVEIVCADRHLTSNDPLEAYLLDGGFVKTWAQACLQRAEQAAASALTSDASFFAFQSSQLQQQLSQMRVLVSVLRSLDRIRAAAAGVTAALTVGGGVAAAAAAAAATAAGGPGAVQDRVSVKAELGQAVLLEQAFQVMDWCARHGLTGPCATQGRFASHGEWSRAVTARRSRAAPRPLFLDSMLQSLSLAGAYPASSIRNMLHMLLFVVRGVDPATWSSKLALLTYHLLDAGVLDVGAAAGDIPAAAAPAPATAAGGSAGWGPRVEAALGDLRRTFRLSVGDVGVWHCCYLLDCASPVVSGAEDPYLARACAMLPSYVTATTPFAFIESLLALGRPDVALAVDRGRLGAAAGSAAAAEAAPAPSAGDAATAASPSSSAPSSGRCYSSLPQAMTLLEIRLRCGLMTEAFLQLRRHIVELAARGGAGEALLRDHCRALLRRLAEWAAEVDARAHGGSEATAEVEAGPGSGVGGGQCLNRLTELPLNAMEEFVLVEWLAEQAEAGRPAGAFLPLFFLQRGRVGEAMAAWRKWTARQDALASAGARAAPAASALLSGLISSALDAQYEAALPAPLRNAVVPVPPGAAAAAATAPTVTLPDLAPGQGAVSILAGLVNQSTPDQPVAVLPFHGTEPPPLITRVVQLPLMQSAPAAGVMAPLPPPSADVDAPVDIGEASSQQAPPAAPSAAAASAVPLPLRPPQPQGPFAAMPLLLPSAAPFRTPPATPGLDVTKIFRAPQQVAAGGAAAAGHQGSTFGGTFGTASGGGGGGGGLLFSVGAGAVAAVGAERPPTAAPGAGGGGGAGGARSYKRSRPND